MTTQYTSILKLALPVTGELSGSWGDVVNDNITSMVEQAIAGLATINTWSANSHTLTTANGVSSESRCAMLVLTDTGTALTGAATVVCPTASKIYIVKNTSGQSATITTAAGTGVAIPNGETMFVFCDGTNVVQAVTRIASADVDFAKLKGTGAVVVTNILDEDDMVSDSATALATQQSIKAYVDSQISANNDLSEILANGNTTGGTDIAVSAGDDITFTDTSKAIFGTDGDLEVYHDGSNAYATNTTGSVIVGASGLSVTNAAGTETQITSAENGAVTLYYDNTATLATTATGVFIAGNLANTGDVRIGIQNTDADLTTYGTGSLTLSTNEGTNSGTITIAQGVDGNITFAPNGTGYTYTNRLYTPDDALIYGLTVGRGAGAVSTNTAVGASALAANTSGLANTAMGADVMSANTTGGYNSAYGRNALGSNTTGNDNTALGYNSLVLGTIGSGNTAVGHSSLLNNTAADYNTAVGRSALEANTTASNNTAVGYQAGYSNTTGGITAMGYQALYANTTATNNTAFGYQAALANTTGYENSVFGSGAFVANTTGAANVAIGRGALQANTTASANVAVGYQAGYDNTTGAGITGVGYLALANNTTANNNTGVGNYALYLNTTGTENAAVGTQALNSNATGNYNTALGSAALYSNTTASNNTAVGYQAGYSNTTGTEVNAFGFGALYSNTTGAGNAAFGMNVLRSNTTGAGNTAFGNQHTGVTNATLYSNTSGSYNTAVGTGALVSNTTGSSNTAQGYWALASNTTASNNTAVGYQALYANTTGHSNVAVGKGALVANTTGTYCVAVGLDAISATNTGNFNVGVGRTVLYSNTSGTQNVAINVDSLESNTTGSYNIAIGGSSLRANITGSYNVGVGFETLRYNTVDANTAVGNQALKANTSGGQNTAVGQQALTSNTTGPSNTAVGRVALYSNTTGGGNNAFGYHALEGNTTASGNNAFGESALRYNTTGASNTAFGQSALYSNTTASQGTAVGYQAGYSNTTGENLVAIGYKAGYTSNANNSTYVGYYAGQGTTGTLNTFVGVNGVGYLVSTGTRNTIIGGFNGNQGGLDIRTSNNKVVLSDGDGRPYYYGVSPATHYLGIPSSGTTYRESIGYQSALFLTNANIGIWGSVQSRADYVALALNSWIDTDATNKYLNSSYGVAELSATAGTVAGTGTYTFRFADPGTAGAACSPLTSVYAQQNGITLGANRSNFSGTGIEFPATQNASSNANTLDDYEEGSFTPAFTATGVTLNNANQYGYYTKIGNRVVAQIYIRCLYVSGTHADITVTGLPFTSANGSFIQHSAMIGYCDGFTGLTYSQIFSYIGSNSTSAALLNGNYQGGIVNVSTSKIGGGSGAYLVATYVYQTP